MQHWMRKARKFELIESLKARYNAKEVEELKGLQVLELQELALQARASWLQVEKVSSVTIYRELGIRKAKREIKSLRRQDGTVTED